MNDQELRSIVRAAIARHTSAAAATEPSAVPPASSASSAGPGDWRAHASHAIYASLVNTSTACVIEPTVTCNHCNYCRSQGH